ncbi:hypothetical protein HORIV_45260 [Vreelandella olivaria]|uniref:Uncharacterized protein n=1 Tax=Vreelandella olivaria TaxID=390919 RepID=A0ABM7GN88_9GAMM|nr:hypothetical protein HORIV_45260 [Halomonas olivaria]
MRKDNDIEALKRQSSSEFDYQNFSTDKRSSGSKQRWKLLDGVANYSPGMRKSPVRKSGEFSPADAPASEETPRLTPQVSTPKQATTVPVSPTMVKRVNIGSRRALVLFQCHLVREVWGLLNQFFEHLRLIKRQRANLRLLETFSKAIPRTAKTLKIP